ncbi:MAG: hypothetical protein ACKVHU_14520 [Acidimicrobiales bacterium]
MFAGSLPDDEFVSRVTVEHDRGEIILTGTLATPEVADQGVDSVAEHARVAAF